MGKRSPRDLTPPDQIIDWADEAERASMRENPQEPPSTEPPKRWYDLLEGAARDDFFGEPAAAVPDEEHRDHWHQVMAHSWPSLDPGLGLPRLCGEDYGRRKEILQKEGQKFRETFDEGVYRVKNAEEILAELDVRDSYKYNDTYAPEEFGYPRNTGFPGALTLTGLDFLNALPEPTFSEEFIDTPDGGTVFWLMKRSHKAKLERLRKKKEMERVE